MACVLWIDDSAPDPERKATIARLRRHTRGILIQAVHPGELPPNAVEWTVHGKSPDLVLIDYNLSPKEFKGSKFSRGGLSVAAQIREVTPEIPIFGFSVDAEGQNLANLSPFARWVFDETLPYSKLQEPHSGEWLVRESNWYATLRNADLRPQDPSSFVQPLRAPKSSATKMVEVVKSDFLPLPYLFGGSSSIGFAKWLRLVLLDRPGPLWPTTYMLSVLGVRASALGAVRKRLSQALYQGVFAGSASERWWSKEVVTIVEDSASSKPRLGPQLSAAAASGLGLGKKALAPCIVCGKEYPDCAATRPGSEGEWFPAHFSCSVHDPERPDRLHFDEPRILVPRRTA
jgi:CheY-like chemotaxis protein